MEGIKILKRPKLKHPYLIVAWPGMGDVAFKAASYLVKELGAKDFAEIPPEDYFYLTTSVIQEGLLDLPELPQSTFYYWKNPATKSHPRTSRKPQSSLTPDLKMPDHDLIIFMSNAQPDLAKAGAYSEKIIQLAKSFHVEMIISLASMPQPVDHTQESRVWFACTSLEVKKELEAFNPVLLPEGQISGMNGLFLGLAKRRGLKGFCLLGEIPLYTIQIENPKACLAVLGMLARILNIEMDFSPLLEQVRHMESEINKLLDYFKVGSGGQISPIGEEEIEKIKKTLSQLTKLPVSVKEKIEKIFEQAKFDISKAAELKAELDKWNVYKEYEDRFLDLFKKTKEKGN
jgi:proteasome assembly chaperone (PAC2) family protein